MCFSKHLGLSFLFSLCNPHIPDRTPQSSYLPLIFSPGSYHDGYQNVAFIAPHVSGFSAWGNSSLRYGLLAEVSREWNLVHG